VLRFPAYLGVAFFKTCHILKLGKFFMREVDIDVFELCDIKLWSPEVVIRVTKLE
jgi:hypothetical protein